MKTRPKLRLLPIIPLSLSGFAHGQGIAFNYQGFLTLPGAPANAIFDLRFTIYASASGGCVAGGAVDAGAVGV